MGNEEFEDGGLVATCNDYGVEMDCDDNQIDMTIERAQRLRDWLIRVLPESEFEQHSENRMGES